MLPKRLPPLTPAESLETTRIYSASLEETAISDDGLRRLSGLKELVWLNPYGTRVGDDGLAHLKRLTRLEHLPLGETRLTDAGLIHLVGLRRLTDLGLRGDRTPTRDCSPSGS